MHNEAHQPDCCCCYKPRTGLRVLGWYWLFVLIISLAVIWIPFFWTEVIASYITYLPPFVVFVQMIQNDDKAEYREKLYKTYMIFGSLGLVLTAASQIYIYYNLYEM